MDFTPAQHSAITLPGHLVVTAGAGSGKTRVLVERYIQLLTTLSAETDQRSILAITFTDKAAREMRDRIRTLVEQRTRQATTASERATWEQHRTTLEAAPLGTIHSFCAAFLRAQPAETGLDPQFRVLDEVESQLLLRASVDEALSAVATGSCPPELAALLEQLQQSFDLDELRRLLIIMLEGGSEVRQAVATLSPDPATLQTQWHSQFSKVQQQARQDLFHSSTWQSACATIIQLAPTAPTTDPIGQQIAAIAQWLAHIDLTNAQALSTIDLTPLETINLRGGAPSRWGTPERLHTAKTTLTQLRNHYKQYTELLTHTPDDTLEQETTAAVLALALLYHFARQQYQRNKQERDLLDFDDLEYRTRELLEQYPAVRARWQAEYHALLVDEFQDTNDEQRAIIYALTGLHTTPESSHPATHQTTSLPQLFVVGDGKQSIYRFRGADVSVFRRVAADIQKYGGQQVALDTSFRTHERLLTWINQISAALFQRDHDLQPYEIPFEPLQARRPASPHPGCVELHIIPNSNNNATQRHTEAQNLVQRLQTLTTADAPPLVYDQPQQTWRRATYGDVAILCQTSTVFAYYEEALRTAGIPYLTTAGRGYYSRKEVQDLIHLLRVLSNPADELALVGVLRSPLFALEDATILRLRFANQQSLWDALCSAAFVPPTPESQAAAFARTLLQQLYALRGQLTALELLRVALAETGYLATISGLSDGARRRSNVEKLLAAARHTPDPGLLAFSAYLEELLQTDVREGEAPLETAGSIRLMTIHASKGLEFPIVVLPDLGRKPPNRTEKLLARRAYGLALRLRDDINESRQPLAYRIAAQAERQMERAERERLLYVALTRASDYLLLSGPAQNKSDETWLSRIVAALGQPWEKGGPPPGQQGALTVFHVQAEP